CCLARKISAVPPSAILRKIVYRACRLIRADSEFVTLPRRRPLDDRRSTGQLTRNGGRERTEAQAMMSARTVLLVEDDLDIRDILQDVLESDGYDVIPAANGKQALDFLKMNDPPGADLVILDLMMPLVTGWEVLDRMQEDPRLAEIPVIVVSAV